MSVFKKALSVAYISTFLAMPLASAGPVISGGSPPTPNWLSKMHIQAVMDEVTEIDDEVIAIERTQQNKFVVMIKNGNCTRQELYQVKSIKITDDPNLTDAYELKGQLVKVLSAPVCT